MRKLCECRRVAILILPVSLAALAGSVAAEDALAPSEFMIDPPTLHALGFRWYVNGDDNGNATARLTYRKKGTEEWREALPLLRVNREVVDRDHGRYRCDNLFAGSLMNLQPDTEYEARISMEDPDGGKTQKTVTARTRAEPRYPEPERILHVYPQAFEGERKKELGFDTLAAALAEVRPGDEVRLYPGVHAGNVSIHKPGTVEKPIVIRGAGGGEATLQGTADDKGMGFNLNVTGSHHLFIEDLTLKGGDWAVYAGERIEPDGTEHLVIRRCRIIDAGTGIRTYSPGSAHWYIADNTIIGRNEKWYPRDSPKNSHTGINIYGRGHVVCHNRIAKFWDCLAIANFGPPPKDRKLKVVAIDMYGNDLSEALDDCLETDYGCHNIRVWSNRIRDAHVGMSFQPVYGGPVYAFRNELYGFTYTAYKLHNWPSGIMLFNNTSVLNGRAFRSHGGWQNARVWNNLFLGNCAYAMETGSPHPATKLDHNGYRRGTDATRFIKWRDHKMQNLRYATLADFARRAGHEAHGIEFDLDAFENGKWPNVGGTHENAVYDLRLREDSKPVDAGKVIPNVNEDFNGEAPDLGCYERGAPVPKYGPGRGIEGDPGRLTR